MTSVTFTWKEIIICCTYPPGAPSLLVVSLSAQAVETPLQKTVFHPVSFPDPGPSSPRRLLKKIYVCFLGIPVLVLLPFPLPVPFPFSVLPEWIPIRGFGLTGAGE